jgi:hypothetical protein
MAIRYCPKCQANVQETGGFCLLGHRVALDPLSAPLDELRAESAKGEAAKPDAANPEQEPVSNVTPARRRPVVVERRRPVPDKSSEEPEHAENDPITEFAPPPRMDWGPRRPSLSLRPSRHG